jgi:hypothetical protein
MSVDRQQHLSHDLDTFFVNLRFVLDSLEAARQLAQAQWEELKSQIEPRPEGLEPPTDGHHP